MKAHYSIALVLFLITFLIGCNSRNEPSGPDGPGKKVTGPDSIVYYNNDNIKIGKDIFDYDSYGNYILEESYEWNDFIKGYTGYYKGIYEYNATGNLLLFEEYEWEERTGVWIGDEKSTFKYDHLNRIKTNMLYIMYNSKWYEDSKTEYQYDLDGQSVLIQSFDFDNSGWEKYGEDKFIYVYDANNRIAFEEHYIQNSIGQESYWQENLKYLYEYNSKGDTILKIKQYWDEKWKSWDKAVYEYDEYRNKTLEEHYWIDHSGTENFLGGSKWEYKYDSKGNYLEVQNYYMDSFTPDWAPNFKNTYVYDEYGNIQEYTFKWEKGSSESGYAIYFYSKRPAAKVTRMPMNKLNKQKRR